MTLYEQVDELSVSDEEQGNMRITASSGSRGPTEALKRGHTTNNDSFHEGTSDQSVHVEVGTGVDRAMRRKTIFLLIGPLAFLPLSALDMGKDPKTSRCFAVACLMAFYWITEALPLAVTAFLPVVLFPVMGVQTAGEVASNYMKDSNLLFLGGFIVAGAVEKVNLHKRVALGIVNALGMEPRRILLGFMLASGFLSMWLSNTATAAMMVAIAKATLQNMKASQELRSQSDFDEDLETQLSRDGNDSFRKFAVAVLIGVAYACSIGGMSTLTGTGPNVVLMGQFTSLYPEAPSLSFAAWTLFALPVAAIFILVAWVIICVLYIRKLPNGANLGNVDVIRNQTAALGKIGFAERLVLCTFVSLVFLWLLRDPKVFPGWGSLFPDGHVSDGTVSMLCALLLFCLPSEMRMGSPRLLTWKDTEKLPWGVVVLLGGGFALADGFRTSGLTVYFGDAMQSLNITDWNKLGMTIFVCTILAITTELTSNVSSSQIFLPILSAIANKAEIHPLSLMIPATLACSFAFMLPAATPPNALAFSTGIVRVTDLIKVGSFLNIFGIFWVSLAVDYVASPIFSLHEFPDWAKNEV